MKTFGLALVVLGVVALLYGGIGYDRQTRILDVGGMKATTTEHKTIPIAPIVGAIALLAGMVILVVPKQQLR